MRKKLFISAFICAAFLLSGCNHYYPVVRGKIGYAVSGSSSYAEAPAGSSPCSAPAAFSSSEIVNSSDCQYPGAAENQWKEKTVYPSERTSCSVGKPKIPSSSNREKKQDGASQIHTGSATAPKNASGTIDSLNAAIQATNSQEIICYRFDNTVTGAAKIEKTGNMQIKTGGTDTFLLLVNAAPGDYENADYYYCTGNTVYIAQYSKIAKTSITLSRPYCHSDFYRYIDCFNPLISEKSVRSLQIFSTGDGMQSFSFQYGNEGDFCNIFRYLDSNDYFKQTAIRPENTKITGITMTLSINNGKLQSCTQFFDLQFQNRPYQLRLIKDFYYPPANHALTPPSILRTVMGNTQQ